MAATKEPNKVTETVVLVKKCAQTGRTIEIIQLGPNIVTNFGDRYYAERSAVQTPIRTYNLGQMVVTRSMTVNPSKTSTFAQLRIPAGDVTGRQSFESGYPKTNDSDTDNTGRTADAVTYKTIYASGEANYSFAGIAICRPGGITTASAATLRQLLNAKTFAQASKFVKTSAITVTVYVNHTFNGV